MGRGLLLFRYSTPSENQNTIPIYCPGILVLNFTHLDWSYYPYTLSPTKSSNFTSNSNIFKTLYLSYCFWKHTCLSLHNPSPLFFVTESWFLAKPSSLRNCHYSQFRGKSWLIWVPFPWMGIGSIWIQFCQWDMGRNLLGKLLRKVSSFPLTDPHGVTFFWNCSHLLVTVI